MELKEIVRRLKMNQSIKAIKRETGKHRSVIRRVRELAEQEGWLEDDQLPSEQQLQERYHDQRHAEQDAAHPLDAYREQIAEWLKQRYSLLVIHKLLAQVGVEYSESTVRRYVHRHFPTPVRPVMRRETRPGEVMDVDFGHLGLTWDTATRSRRRTWVCSRADCAIRAGRTARWSSISSSRRSSPATSTPSSASAGCRRK